MATIKDIAKRLNVSVSTVSYALNGGPRRVPEDVKQRVLEVAQEIGYRPNRLAKSLVTRKTNTIAVVPSEASVHLAITPFFQLVFDGILNAAEIAKHDVLVVTGHDHHEPERLADTLLDGRIDGAIFLAPRVGRDFFCALETGGLPFVILNSRVMPGSPTIVCDNENGAREAADHLLSLGHRRIGLLMGNAWSGDSTEREAAFLSHLQAAGVHVSPDHIANGDLTRHDGREAALRILSRADQPTALFCCNDEMAFGAMEAARELGLRIPEDLSLIGFDATALSELVQPALTTVEQPLTQMGAKAAETLFRAMAGDVAVPSVFPTRLLIRASTSQPTKGEN